MILQWDKNINEITKKANQKIVHSPAAQEVWIQWWWAFVCLQCYVRPVVEYADVAWFSSVTAQQRKILEHLQTRTCRTILGQRYTTYICDCVGDLWACLLRGGKVIVVGLPKGLPILNVQITSFLLPDWSLTPATCVIQVITLNCASEHHASETVQSHTLSTS